MVLGDRAVKSSPEMTGKADPCWGAADLAPGRLGLRGTVRAHKGGTGSAGKQLDAKSKVGSDLLAHCPGPSRCSTVIYY